MNCFINHFSFENHKKSITDEEIKDTLNDLVSLLNIFKKNNFNLIFNYMFSKTQINGQELKKHVLKLDQKNRVFLLKSLDTGKPFCANLFDDYQDDEFIMSNCKEKTEKIDILETFLACAMYFKAPIVTADKFCSKVQFFKDDIEIECNEGKIQNLKNYKLSEYEKMIDEFNKERFLNIDSWNEYFEYIDQSFKRITLTSECKENFRKYSFDSPQGKLIKNEIERFEKFINEKYETSITNINYKDLDKNINEESSTKKSKKKAQLTSKDINGKSMVMSWHARVNDDFRLYFYFVDEKVCFTMFCPKIPDS